MKKFRKSALAILAILAIFLVFGLWYKYTYSMGQAEALEVNTPDSDKKLLIATQGSDFKNRLTQGIVDHYKSGAIFIKVIDVSDLDEIVPEDYDAVLVVHTWEYEKPPQAVSSFMEKSKNLMSKVVLMTTSGPGTSTMEGVDAITGESVLDDVPIYIASVIERLDPLLDTEN